MAIHLIGPLTPTTCSGGGGGDRIKVGLDLGLAATKMLVGSDRLLQYL
jgi:hypothetical protein